MANEYQNILKGRLLSLAELSDMFCIVKSNHILMSNGTNIIIPTDRDMKDGDLALYLNNLSEYLRIDDYDLDPNDPDTVDQLYYRVKDELIRQKSEMSNEEFEDLLDRIDTVESALDNEVGSYTEPAYREVAMEVVRIAAQNTADILGQVRQNRKQQGQDEKI